MGSTFTATASVDLFANPSHTVALSYFTTFDLLPFPHFETHFDFGFDGGDLPRSGDPVDAMKDTAIAMARRSTSSTSSPATRSTTAYPPHRSSSISSARRSTADSPRATGSSMGR